MIQIQSLSKHFALKDAAVYALKNINLEIGDKEFFVLLGPSGSGKSTLLRCLAGIEDPDSGVISLGEKLIYSSEKQVKIPPDQRGVGMVFQSYAVWPHLTVFENVALPLKYGANQIPQSKIKDQVMQSLAMVQLEGLADRPVPFLSGGQQQRVALARALAIRPSVLLMDEPLSNLDARLREEVRHEIRKITREIGVAVVYVTHDQSEALSLADRIAVMNSGEIMQVGSPEDIFFTPRNSLVADFVGEMNWFYGNVGEKGLVTVPFGELASNSNEKNKVKIGIRPTTIELNALQVGNENEFEAEIIDEIFLGEQVEYRIALKNNQILKARLNKRSREENKNKKVWCTLAKTDLFIYPETT